MYHYMAITDENRIKLDVVYPMCVCSWIMHSQRIKCNFLLPLIRQAFTKMNFVLYTNKSNGTCILQVFREVLDIIHALSLVPVLILGYQNWFQVRFICSSAYYIYIYISRYSLCTRIELISNKFKLDSL